MKRVLESWLARLKGSGAIAVLIRGASGALSVRLLGTLSAFLVQVYLARTLRVREYGFYVYVLAWVGVLVVFSLLGLDSATQRFLPAHRARQEWAYFRGYLRASHAWGLIASTVVGVGMAVVVSLLRPRLGEGLWATFLVACLLLPVVVMVEVHGAGMRALKRVVLAALPGGVFRHVLIFLGIAGATLVWGGRLDSTGAMAVNLGGTLLVLLILGILLERSLPEAGRVGVGRRDSRAWLTAALHMMVVSSCGLVINGTGVVMLGTFLDTTSAGVYAVAQRVATLVAFGLAAVETIAAPLMAELYSKGQMAELQKVTRVAAGATFVVALPAFVAFIFAGQLVLGIFGAEFKAGYSSLVVLSLGQLVNAVAGPAGLIMVMSGHHKQAGLIMGLAAVGSLLLNAVLIPLLGTVGVAVAVAVVMTGWNIVMVAYVKRRIMINPTLLPLGV